MSFIIAFGEDCISLATDRIAPEDAARQERSAREILRRLDTQPGLVLSDEVGMGKTFVALAVAASVALARPNEWPIVVMVPSSLKQKWPKDWAVFREHCLRGRAENLRADSADSGVAFMRLLDDPPERRKALVFLTHGALHRALTDEWVKLALIRRALYRRKAVGTLTAEQVRAALPKFAGRILRNQRIDRKAPELWRRLLEHPPSEWRRLIEAAGFDDLAQDDPVPEPLIEAMEDLDLGPVLSTLADLPLRESSHVDDRLRRVRQALAGALADLWKAWQSRARFRLPLLIFDEAHHLKNWTRLTSLFAEEEAQGDSEAVARGPLAGVFKRMLFLTATPFQLGHHELIAVLRRFEGIAWEGPDAPLTGRAVFTDGITQLEQALDAAQAAALRLEEAWGRLRLEHLVAADGPPLSPQEWWQRLEASPPTDGHAAEIHLRYRQCFDQMGRAEALLRPWVVRHLKLRHLPGGSEPVPPPRRQVLVGASIRQDRALVGDPGLEVEGDGLLPFLLAARAQVALASAAARGGDARRAVFAEGLASSYEAYLETRRGALSGDDDEGDGRPGHGEDPEVVWYLEHLDRALPDDDQEARARHPKVLETINRALALWWEGEKSLIFCHYRATGRALRRYVSFRLREQILDRAHTRLGVPDREEAWAALDRLGEQFFDTEGRLRREATAVLDELVSRQPKLLAGDRDRVVEIALRFLRTPSFLVRYFPVEVDDPSAAFREAFERPDASGLGVRRRIEDLCHFLAERCVAEEREEYLEALLRIQTGAFRRERTDPDDPTDQVFYLPNVRLANGELPQEARRRLMLAFNAPFFPEILIASSVLAEGVDLHLDCRYVVHHDLSWNPSTLEQRTGRVDRLGAKAERARRSIHVYLPFVTATQDEKMFRVVRDRERWFAVVMGERYQTDERTTDRLAERVPFPETAARALAFDLSVPTG